MLRAAGPAGAVVLPCNGVIQGWSLCAWFCALGGHLREAVPSPLFFLDSWLMETLGLRTGSYLLGYGEPASNRDLEIDLGFSVPIRNSLCTHACTNVHATSAFYKAFSLTKLIYVMFLKPKDIRVRL